jgi:hypothetical protein
MLSHSVVVVVIANYVEGLLVTVLCLSVIEMWSVLLCRIGKMSVGQNVQED